MKYIQYSTVKLVKINRQFNENELSFGVREPKEGDVAAIVEVYENPSLGYELECINENGIMQWLATFSPEDAEFELISENT